MDVGGMGKYYGEQMLQTIDSAIKLNPCPYLNWHLSQPDRRKTNIFPLSRIYGIIIFIKKYFFRKEKDTIAKFLKNYDRSLENFLVNLGKLQVN